MRSTHSINFYSHDFYYHFLFYITKLPHKLSCCDPKLWFFLFLTHSCIFFCFSLSAVSVCAYVPTCMFVYILFMFTYVCTYMNNIEEEKVEFELLIILKMRKHSNSFSPSLCSVSFSLSLTLFQRDLNYFFGVLLAFRLHQKNVYIKGKYGRREILYQKKKNLSPFIFEPDEKYDTVKCINCRGKGWGYKKESLKWKKNPFFTKVYFLFYF